MKERRRHWEKKTKEHRICRLSRWETTVYISHTNKIFEGASELQREPGKNGKKEGEKTRQLRDNSLGFQGGRVQKVGEGVGSGNQKVSVSLYSL